MFNCHESNNFEAAGRAPISRGFNPGGGRPGSPVHPMPGHGHPAPPRSPHHGHPAPPRPPHHGHPAPPRPPHHGHPAPPMPVQAVPVNVSVGAQPPVLRPPTPFKDYGPGPFVLNIEQATLDNDFYRQTIWSGPHMQSTLMCIPVGGDIGLEVHPDNDQFLRLEQGQGLVQMGDTEDHLTFTQTVFENCAVFVPAGTWHNITNIGTEPMKLYVIYAPPHHPHGTVHPTKSIADEMGD